MKTIITVFLLFLISVTALSMEGIHKGDTVRYKFENMLIEVASSNALQKGIAMDSSVVRIKQIQQILNEITIAAPEDNEQVTISFKEMGDDEFVKTYKEIELNRSKKENKTLVIFEDGSTFEKDFGNYCIVINDKASTLKIFLNDLADLDLFYTDGFAEKVNSSKEFMAEKFEHKSRKTISEWLDLRDTVIKGYTGSSAAQTNDQIELSAGIGSGWVKNTFVSDISFRMGLSFGKKGVYKNSYHVDWNMMYDFSESNENKFYELNHFVSLGWDHNFSNTPNDNKWYGFSVGYLVKRNNDFFKENTFKVGVNKKINNTFIVKPELYFNDFFKNVYPGIRLSVAF